MPYTRHLGFKNVTWAGLSLDYCVSLNWTAGFAEVWSLRDDDEVSVLTVCPSGMGGQITLVGRKLLSVLPVYAGRTSDMTIDAIIADMDGSVAENVTLQDATLISFGLAMNTVGLAERTLTFNYSNLTGDKSIYAMTPE